MDVPKKVCFLNTRPNSIYSFMYIYAYLQLSDHTYPNISNHIYARKSLISEVEFIFSKIVALLLKARHVFLKRLDNPFSVTNMNELCKVFSVNFIQACQVIFQKFNLNQAGLFEDSFFWAVNLTSAPFIFREEII